MLIQQASNWLLSVAQRGFENFELESPIKSADFLKDYSTLMKSKFQARNITEAANDKVILEALNWLCAFTLQKTLTKSKNLQQDKKASAFDIRNNIQVFHANTLAICYAQRNVYRVFNDFVLNLPNSNEKDVLKDLLVLYGSNLIVKNSGLFYQGSYFESASQIEMYENLILELLVKIKVNSISLIDSITYPDHIINSCLGYKDGNVYKNLESALYNLPGTFERPAWWQDIVHKESYMNAKL